MTFPGLAPDYIYLPVGKPSHLGILRAKGVRNMKLTGLAISAGLGAAAGMVAVMMLPRQNPVRKLAAKAANKAEDLAWKVEDKMNEMDF